MRGKVWMGIIILASIGIGSIMADAAAIKSIYKVTRLSPTVLGVSCPGNGGDPAVIRNISGVLLISCGTYSEADLTK